MVLEQRLRAYILTHKQLTTSKTTGVGFWILKVHNLWHTFSNMVTPNPSLTVQLIVDQSIKYESMGAIAIQIITVYCHAILVWTCITKLLSRFMICYAFGYTYWLFEYFLWNKLFVNFPHFKFYHHLFVFISAIEFGLNIYILRAYVHISVMCILCTYSLSAMSNCVVFFFLF